MSPLKKFLFELQEISILLYQTFVGLFSRPRYFRESLIQMDIIGVGSLPIVIMTGFFTGAVLTLQTYPTLETYGGQSQTGQLVAYSLIRELGPVTFGVDGFR